MTALRSFTPCASRCSPLMDCGTRDSPLRSTRSRSQIASLPGKWAGTPYFDVSVVGVRKKVRSGHGLAIPVRAITQGLKPDWVIVPALKTATPELLLPSLARPDVKQAKSQLLKWHAEGARIAASCIGTFLLAETGLLDHREATTTWWLAPLFRQRYPNVLLDESRMLVVL